MTRVATTVMSLALLSVCAAAVAGQSGTGLAERTALAIRYEEGKSTEVLVNGTAIAPQLRGKAKVKTDRGSAEIELELEDVPPAVNVAPGYATYVVWAVMPDGRTQNLGEVPWRNPEQKIKTKLAVQRFALFVTAEPYGAVRRPSPRIAAENKLKEGERVATTSSVTYQGDDGALYRESRDENDTRTPVPVVAARLAVQIAARAGAALFAQTELQQANDTLSRMDAEYGDKPKDEGRWGSFARETQTLAHAARLRAVERAAQAALDQERATQAKAVDDARVAAESARLAATVERERATAERLAAEKATAEQRAAQQAAERATAGQQAALAAAQKAAAEQQAALAAAQRATAEQKAAQLAAERATAEQRAATAEAERARKEAAAAQEQTLAARTELAAAQDVAKAAREQADQARQQAESAAREAEAARAAQIASSGEAQAALKRAAQAEQDRDAMARQLESSLNAILETRRTARGLVVNIGDVLFDVGQATLRPEARERLSRMSGVLLAYPAKYTLEFEGHTDSTGSDELNNRLSDARASSVRDYVVGAGVAGDRVIGTRGFGKADPVADNETVAGRQKNRRVEIVINDAR